MEDSLVVVPVYIPEKDAFMYHIEITNPVHNKKTLRTLGSWLKPGESTYVRIFTYLSRYNAGGHPSTFSRRLIALRAIRNRLAIEEGHLREQGFEWSVNSEGSLV